MPLYVFLGVLALLVVWPILIYNGLVRLRNQVQNAWRQIDVQLKRRHDLIPNLVETVRGAMEFERGTLTQVVEARAKAMTATGPAQAARLEGELTQALGRLFALAEQYPLLTANQNIKLLQEELSSTENKVGFARQLYNDVATEFNIKQETFPSDLIASTFNFTRAELFEIQDAAEREVPKVDLKIGRNRTPDTGP